MSNLLNNAVTDRLQPMAPLPAVAPEIISDNDGDPIFNLKPSKTDKGLTQELEIAFTTRSPQTYAIQYLDENPNLTRTSNNPLKKVWVTAASGIQGTNGPVYQYIKGIPLDIDIDEVRVQWIGSSLSPLLKQAGLDDLNLNIAADITSVEAGLSSSL